MKAPSRSHRIGKGARAPTGIAVAYAAALRAWQDPAHAKAKAEIIAWYNRAHKKEIATHHRSDASHTAPIMKRIKIILEDPNPPIATVDAVGARVDKRNALDMGRVIGIPMRAVAPAHTIETWRDHNVALIQSLPDDLLPDVESVLREAEAQGWRVEDLADRLQERFDVSDSHADLIARDQVLKLNGQLTEFRQTRAGITHYVWTTSDDERVRPMHADLEGTAHAWDDPPIVDEKTDRREHPGRDYQCRCTAFPLLEELGENESLYPDG